MSTTSGTIHPTIRQSDDRIIGIVYWLVDEVRGKYIDDVYQFMNEGHSEHDCYEINSELLKLMSKHGIKGRIVRLGQTKHYLVEFEAGGRIYYADAVPELSGQFSYVLGRGFIGTEKELVKFYGLY